MQTQAFSARSAGVQPAGRATFRVQMSQNKATPKAVAPKSTDKIAAGLIGAAAAVVFALAPPALAREPFLKSTGARGPLANEEAELLLLREQKEALALEEIEKAREYYEDEARGQLCATPFGIDVVGITEFVALTGALVGGISARRRKQELEKLNEQLRTINSQLRQQARAGTLYAPGLTYAPAVPGSSNGNGAEGPLTIPSGASSTASITIPKPPAVVEEIPLSIPAVDESSSVTASFGSENNAVSLMSIDEEDSGEAKQCQQALKDGKKLLKDRNTGAAMVRFEKALMLAKHLNDKVRERRAVRGLAAACRYSGQSRSAIKYLERVLEISKEIGEYTGDADAYGTIADVYADIGEFEKAAEYYDKYIYRMNKDGPV